MESIILWSIIILIAMTLILYYKGLRKVRRIFNEQCALYKDGVTVGRAYQTSKELYEDFSKGNYRISMGEGDRVIVYGQLAEHRFFLEDGNVKYEYPKDLSLLAFNSVRRTTRQMQLAHKIKIIVEANQIMDELREINGAMKENKYSDALERASSGQKMMWASFLPMLLALVPMLAAVYMQAQEENSNESAIEAWSSAQNNDDILQSIKNTAPYTEYSSTYGQVLGFYLDHTDDWTYFTAEDGTFIVQCEGAMSYPDGSTDQVLIQFAFDGKTAEDITDSSSAEVVYMEIDGTAVSADIKELFDMYENL